MAEALNWIAIRTSLHDEMLERLELARTREERGDVEAAYLGFYTPGEWVGVIENEDHAKVRRTGWLSGTSVFADPATARELSKLGELVVCSWNKRTMNSHAAGWVDGHERWAIVHEAHRGLDHLTQRGGPPDPDGEIVKRAMRQYVGETKRHADAATAVDHLFSAPIEIATHEVGFGTATDGSPRYEVLRPVERTKGWFARLTG